MNRVTKKLPQSRSLQPPPQQPAAKKERNLKRERFPENPSRDLGTRTSVSSNVSGSGSTSGEASNASHRFLLSHSFSSSSSTSSSLGVFNNGGNRPVRAVAKTPKSDPVVSKPLIRKKPRLMDETKLKPKLQRSKPNPKLGKKPAPKGTMKPEKVTTLKKQASVSKELKLKDTIRVDDRIAPMCNVVTRSEAMDDDGRLSNSNSSYQDRTPPVQASVSPEIQCGSSMNVSGSACYAAGHLLSGVSDKRKCKPKGILTVGENRFVVGKAKLLNDFDELSDGSYDNISMMPLPVDASEHWLEKIVECVGHESSSPLSDRSTSSDLCNISSGRSLSPTMRRISSSLSPNELSRFRRFMDLSSCEGVATTPSCELGKGNKPSPLSADTLGSENVIQTPESNSSFDNYFGLLSPQAEIQKKHDGGSDLESLTMSFQSAALSPRSQVSSREPSSSSFNFDSLATSSVSVDLSQFQRALADRVSRRHEREINSHMPNTKSQQSSDTEFDKGRELLPCSAAESISTDGGGGLVCSEDSNWMDCYKKNFLDE